MGEKQNQARFICPSVLHRNVNPGSQATFDGGRAGSQRDEDLRMNQIISGFPAAAGRCNGAGKNDNKRFG